MTLTPGTAIISTANLTQTVSVGGSATGPITLDTSNLPPGITATVNQVAGTITITAMQPAAGQPAINETFDLLVLRDGIETTLTVIVNIQALPPTGGGGLPQPPVQPDPPEGPSRPDEYTYTYHEAYMFGNAQGFRPRANTTRAEVVAILVRTMVEDFAHGEYPADIATLATFSDVTSANWFYWYIVWAQAEGLIEGREDGRFRPNGPITRQEYGSHGRQNRRHSRNRQPGLCRHKRNRQLGSQLYIHSNQ